MRLYQQLILFVLAATAIPLVIGFAVLRHNEQQLEQRLLASSLDWASRQAEVIDREFRELFERVEGALGYVTMEGMAQDELTGLMGIVYKQSEDIVQVALLHESGREVVAGVFLDEPKRFPEYAGRLGVSAEDHTRFVSGVPMKDALRAPFGSLVVGRPQTHQPGAPARITVAVPVELRTDNKRWVAAVEVSLARLMRQLQDTQGTRGLSALVVDADGQRISGQIDPKAPVDLSADPAVARFMAGQAEGAFFDGERLCAFAKIGLVGWGLVMTQARDEAWAQVRSARIVTLTWTGVSILALLISGLLFTRRITAKLNRLAHGAQSLSKGDLDARVPVGSKDELGLLAQTFNRMGEDLKASRAEIDAWNRELTERVEQRTRELELAHRRLLETSKLAAIGQLGAGVAHEVNNPLVGILGHAQLLLLRTKDDEKAHKALSKIEAAAKRCRDVIQNLLRFSEQDADPEHQACDLNQVIEDAFSLTEQRLLAQQVEVVWELAPDLPRVLGASRQLMQVFLNLFSNARTAMENGGTLTVASRVGEDQLIEIEVIDTGRGIEPENLERIFEPFFTTKDVWTNTGMGLSVVYRIVSDHGGRIEVTSELEKGSRVRVLLPLLEEPS